MDVLTDRAAYVAAALAAAGVVPCGVRRGTVKPCSRCGGPRDRSPMKAYCRACHNAYARENRPTHSELDPEARKRANCRRLTGMLVARGKMEKTPCACGATDVTAQHHDYDDPWAVTWTCRACRVGVSAPAVAA